MLDKLTSKIKAIIFSLAWWILSQFSFFSNRKRVLLAANKDSYLMLSHLAEIHALVKDDNSISFSVTNIEKLAMLRKSTKYWAIINQVRYVNFRLARFLPWHMIVAADHYVISLFNPKVSALLIPHGIAAGKSENGEVYFLNPKRILRPGGASEYTRIAYTTQYIVDDACRRHPWLDKLVFVVGDLRADRLLDMQSKRQKIRQRLGFRKDDKVIMIMSTYGKYSLMETMGRELVNQCFQLEQESRYRFILSTHPHHWSGKNSLKKFFGGYLMEQEKRGFTITRPDESWEPYLIASDIAVSDLTSLAVYFALLKKPMLFIDLTSTSLQPESPIWLLSRMYPSLVDPTCLAADLAIAEEIFSTEKADEFSAKFHSYKGRSEERYRQVFYEVLHSTEPKIRVNGQSHLF